MPIAGWVIFGTIVVFGVALGLGLTIDGGNSASTTILIWLIIIALLIGCFFGIKWLYNNTAAGQRSMTDQKSNFNGGLERTVTVYTANGDVIATYEGKIDIEGNDGGYVLFDFEGKRYVYYNCFVESIAEIG